MSRAKRTVVSLVLTGTLLSSACLLRPAPTYAGTTDTTTIALAVGGSILGIIVISLIITLVIRNDPAWMPALPRDEGPQNQDPWAQPSKVHFGTRCGIRDSVVPLVCW